MLLPEVKIFYNPVLDPIFVAYCLYDPSLQGTGWSKWKPPLSSVLLERINNYKKTWQKYGTEILRGITEILDLSFIQSIIDVHVVSGLPRAISNPLIIKGTLSENHFLITICHELIHLIQQNNRFKVAMEQQLFPQYPKLTQSHILVHAVLKKIYIEILERPDLLAFNKEVSSKSLHEEYMQAWEIVDCLGENFIVESFKHLYKNFNIQSLKATVGRSCS